MSLTSFLGMGVPRHTISIERGVGSTGADGAEQTIDEFECREDQHLLVAMGSIGKSGIPSGCHGGGCGVCKIKILDGEFEQLVMSRKHVSESEEQEGYALACRVFPRSAIRLEVIGKTAVAK